MIKELYVIRNPLEDHTIYCNTYWEFITEFWKLSNQEIQVAWLELLVYDEEYIDIEIWYDWELFITDHETWEDLRELIYKWKYNFEKARLLKLDNNYYKYNFRS